MKKGEKKKFGFTIVEVSLVLAVAGLIFLMVFIALPQLQRQQRDAQRRENVAVFLEAVKKYQTNNRGALPASQSSDTIFSADEDCLPGDAGCNWKDFLNDYLDDSFKDPSGNQYEFYLADCSGDKNKSNCHKSNVYASDTYLMMQIYLHAVCDGSKAVYSSNPRNIAVIHILEGGGVYCANT